MQTHKTYPPACTARILTYVHTHTKVGKAAKDRLTRKHAGIERDSVEPWLSNLSSLLRSLALVLNASSHQETWVSIDFLPGSLFGVIIWSKMTTLSA